MAYSIRSDVDLIYGRRNVDKWADLDNAGTQAIIDARVTWAIALADAEIDSELSGTSYAVPFTGTIPTLIKDLSARLAGVYLYDGRRLGDEEESTDQVRLHRKICAKRVKRIIAGQQVIAGVTRAVNSTPEYTDATLSTVES